MIRSVMFVLKSFEMGGLEVVTSVLANRFVAEGIHVSIFTFYEAEHSIKDWFDKRIHCYVSNGLKYSPENVKAMRSLMISEGTQVVINQWGLPLIPLKVINKASQGLNIRTISVYHNNPSFNGRIHNVQIAIENTNVPLLKFYLKIKKFLFKKVTSYGMRYNYYHSDKYMVLSSCFIDEFIKFTGIKNPKNLIVQTNPITIHDNAYVYSSEQKEKEILYVGRIDKQQKRVDRIIKVWSKLNEHFHDWKLVIVGDGESKEKLQQYVKDNKIKNISFEGYQKPLEYYKRASLLLLTSDYEGFPLVIVEAMRFGVIPIVYGSYQAVYDIIDNGVNGSIVKPVNGDFSEKEFQNVVAKYMSNNDLIRQMAPMSMKKSYKFSLDVISQSWINLFNNIIR